jgi:hypothetical protein
MNDHQLGTALRRQVLADLERGLASDGRRLQALVGDYCGDSQGALLPALKYLVMTPACGHALGQQPPLPADPRLLLRLQQELNSVFTPAICARMDAVLRGLLALPEQAQSPSAPDAPDTAPARETPLDTPPEPPPMAPVPAAAPAPSGQGLVAALGFLAGVLAVGLAGLIGWLVLNRQPLPLLPQPTSSAPAGSTAPSSDAAAPELAPPAPDLQQAALGNAIATVQQLYSDLSNGNGEAARQLIGGGAADQFDLAFFNQFQRVGVSDLREIGRSGALVSLQGVVTFVYPDGSTQSESRSFVVDTATQPALITASGFNQVLKARQ